MKRLRSALWAGILGMVVVVGVSAEPVSVAQLLVLKRAGFSDEQVAAEAAKTGKESSEKAAAPGVVKTDPRIDLNADGIRQLRAAGAGDVLIDALCKLAKKVTPADALEMAKAHQSLEQIVERIIDSCPTPCPRPELAVDEARLLATEQVPPAVIVALLGKPLGPQQLVMLGEAQTPPAVFGKLADTLGFEPVKATPELTKAMTEAGVPGEMIARMEEKAKAAEYEIAKEAWERSGAPFKRLYEAMVATQDDGRQLNVLLLNGREATAQYDAFTAKYYLGDFAEDDVESFFAPSWEIQVHRLGHRDESVGDYVIFVVRSDESGNRMLYQKLPGPFIGDVGYFRWLFGGRTPRVRKTPLNGAQSLAAALGINLTAEPARIGD